MRLRHVVPFLLLFAWQVGPPDHPRDRPSRLRLWLGRGASSYNYAYWGTAGGHCLQYEPGCGCNTSECGCYCSCLRFAPTYPKRFEAEDETDASGIHVEAWPSPTLRVSAARAGASAGMGYRPTYAGGLLAWEGGLMGLGGGWARGAAHVGYEGLAAYARLGSLDGPQFRAELRAPTVTPGVTGWARAGFAYNQQGRQDKIAAFVGISAVAAEPDTMHQTDPGSALARVTRPAFFLDIALPLGRRLDLFGRGHLAKQARGFGFGLALRFGR